MSGRLGFFGTIDFEFRVVLKETGSRFGRRVCYLKLHGTQDYASQT